MTIQSDNLNGPLQIDAIVPSSASVEQDLKSLSEESAVGGEPGNDIPSSLDSKIMIIDDEKFNTLVVKKYLLNAGFKNLLVCTDSTKAFDLIKSEKPDVILLDIIMPEVTGLDILELRRQESNLKYTPVIVLTASTSEELKHTALSLGATDFLAKPVDANDLIPRVRNTLLIREQHAYLQNYAQNLNEQVQSRTQELVRSREDIIHCLGRASEYRDNETGRHVIRVGQYCGVIADQLGFDQDYVEMIQDAAQLHDIGKIGIPDEILLSPNKLSKSEFEIMKTHCQIGREIILPSDESEWIKLRKRDQNNATRKFTSPLMLLAASIADSHHEKWNGTGYPNGLAGEDIPIEGRMTAVADVFDALSSERPYKKAFELDKCISIIHEDSGTHFDPDCVQAFFDRLDDILSIKHEFADVFHHETE